MSHALIAVLLTCSLVALAPSQTVTQSANQGRQSPVPGPCWKAIRLDQAGMVRMDLHGRMSRLASGGGFTQEELKEFPLSDVEEKGASAYGLAYLGWQHSQKDMKFELQKAFKKRRDEAADLPPEQRAFVIGWIAKLEKLMTSAFDLGLQDAKRNPCPF